MIIDLYTPTGEKKGMLELPASLFGGKINVALMHRAVQMQQSSRRRPLAHVKTRGEVRGSTRKLFQQKGTGRARRGPIRSPLLRGGGRTFGPRKDRNFKKNMPRMQRRQALLSSLAYVAKSGKVVGLTEYASAPKTKTFVALLSKLPVQKGRRILFVIPARMDALERGSRNVPGVRTILASYLNPEDLLSAHAVIFLVDALKKAEEVFGKRRGERGGEDERKISSSTSSSSTISPSSRKSTKPSKKVS